MFPCGCPADDAEFVIIAFADGIGAMLDQKTNDREAVLLDSKVQRIGIISFAADVRIGAALEEKSRSRFTVAKDSVMQRGSHPWSGRLVDEPGIRG